MPRLVVPIYRLVVLVSCLVNQMNRLVVPVCCYDPRSLCCLLCINTIYDGSVPLSTYTIYSPLTIVCTANDSFVVSMLQVASYNGMASDSYIGHDAINH